MRGIRTRSLGYGAGLFTLVAMGWILTGRAASPRQAGLPTDWSHRHVIFSQPSTDAQAAAVMHDPRCSHVGSCTRCPGLAFMEGNMRGPSSQDCEKSFVRTGIPSANMLAKKSASANLIQIRIAPPIPAIQPTGAIA